MDTVNYLLLFNGNSSQGGRQTSVRAFVKLEAARAAMMDSYGKFASALNIPVNSSRVCNPYTTKTKNSIRLERYGDVFQWEIMKAVPEDGAPSSTESERWRGMTPYTVIIEERTAQVLSVKAYNIFNAMDSAKAAHKQGALSMAHSRPSARLMMARNDETGEETEWKEF